MRIRPFLSLMALFLLLPPQLIQAQPAANTKKDQPIIKKNNQPNASRFEFGFNESMLISNFDSSAQKRQVFNPGANIVLLIEHPKWYLNTKAQYTFEDFPTIAVSNNMGHEMMKIKRAQTTMGIGYFYLLQNENILNQSSPSIRVDGATGKQKFLLDISESFPLKATLIRFSFLIGGIQFSQKASISMNGRILNAGTDTIYENLTFFREIRVADGAGLSITVRPIKHLILSVNGEQLYLFKNPTNLMPTQQYQAGAEIVCLLYGNLGISVHGSFSNADQGAAVFPKSLSSNIVIMF